MTISDPFTHAGAFERQGETPASEQSKVWDLPVRIFHWALAVSIAGAFVTNRLGISYFKYHVWCGYAVIILVVFRILWGFVGTYHAQFRNFLRGPIATFRYARRLFRGRHVEYAGHNPLGAWMVVLLLIILGAQAATGLFSNDDIFNVGPLYGYVTKDVSSKLTSLHRHLFYWIAAAIAIHIMAVFVHRAFGDVGLVRAMVTGRKQGRAASAKSIASSRIWIAISLIIAIAGLLAWIVWHAPVPIEDSF